MYRKLKGLLYGVFFVLMGILILYDNHTTTELSKVMTVLDNVYGANVFGLAFILAGVLNFGTGWSGRDWQIIGFAPYIIYGTGVLHITFTEHTISFVGGLVYVTLIGFMITDWFADMRNYRRR